MDEISELLKEAKPLYFKRKRTREITKRCLYAIVPIIICSFVLSPFSSISNNSTELSYYTGSTSVVEEMGLPTDDYGLLKVD